MVNHEKYYLKPDDELIQRAANANLKNLRLRQQTAAVALIQSLQAKWGRLEFNNEHVHPLAEEAWHVELSPKHP